MTTNSNILLFEGKPLKAVYFLGIGGIGMSALARYYNSRGVRVSGYDKTPTALTTSLQQEGINVHFTDDVNLADKEAAFVVFTPAIPADHAELNYFKQHHYPMRKRSEVLGSITRPHFNICVAGTHGKTTTSSMIAHLLRDSGYGCNAFLGGIAANYNSNYWSHERNVYVAEADEYDRSFLQLEPDIAIITSMDADHLDIYGTEKNMQDAFVAFASKIKPGGLLIAKRNLPRQDDFLVSNKMQYDATHSDVAIYAQNIRIQNGGYCFDAVVGNRTIKNVILNMGGMHNVENAMACIAVALQMEISEEQIVKAIANFKGVRRRFEYILKPQDEAGTVMIDDYAHHPQELKALIEGAQNLYPHKQLTVVFQPHLYSRTRDHAQGFADVLSMAHQTILLPIYPARELPMPGVSSQMILDKMSNAQHQILSKEELLLWIKDNPTQLLIICGAGDIDTLVQPIKELITQKN